MSADPWITGRETVVRAAPTLSLGAQRLEVGIRGHPQIPGLLYVDWSGGGVDFSLNGTREQLRDLLARSLDALDAHEEEVRPTT
jgi:hypothetical protein